MKNGHVTLALVLGDQACIVRALILAHDVFPLKLAGIYPQRSFVCHGVSVNSFLVLDRKKRSAHAIHNLVTRFIPRYLELRLFFGA